jgi:multidrug efflux pump subunit AcrA (membrane-fusion protein)
MKQIIGRHHFIIAAVGAALPLGAALAGCAARPSAAAAAGTTEPIGVSTARVALTDVAGAIDAGGVVQARVTATIAARILAPIRDIRVSPGDRVRAGQTLIVLDGTDLAAGARAARAAAVAAEHGASAAAAELQAAEAGLALARASHRRIAALQAKGSATAQELDDVVALLRAADARVAAASARTLQAAAGIESARAAGDQASTTNAFTIITAPFDGLITAKLADPGNLASPGMPLLRLEDTAGFRLEVRADESRIGQVRSGDSVPVFLGAATASIEGTVVEVGRAVDADARAFLVKIALPAQLSIRSGEFGKARFAAASRRALTVPPSAVVHRGQLTSVFVVEDGLARVRFVSLRESEVLAGLAESEVVILSPPAGLTDGRRVSEKGR